jgi:hypothetical protein
MFFFPKDNSNTAPNLRPIAVSNTDNRLIASILHTLISPAILKLLDPAQRARPGAPIDENVAFFNECFYAAVESKQDYHLLLHDFEKAFDRTSRHYLLALLRHIGAPSWVINLLVTLFENVVALPIRDNLYMSLTLAQVVGRPRRILMPSPPSNPPYLPYAP